MSTKSDFNSKSPNGITDTNKLADKGQKVYEQYVKEGERAASSVTAAIKTQYELDDLRKKIENVEKASSKAVGERRKSLEAYLEKLNEEYITEESRLNEISEKVKERYGTDLETFKQSFESVFKDIEKNIDDELEKIQKEREEIINDSSLSKEQRTSKLFDLDKKERAEESRKEQVKESKSNILSGRGGIFGKALTSGLNIPGLGFGNGIIGTALSGLSKGLLKSEGFLGKIANAVPGLATNESVKDLGTKVKDIVKDLKPIMDKAINSAAKTMEGYYGRINANLENSIYSGSNGLNAFKQISADVANSIGLSRLIDQTKYLSKIAELSDSGLVNDIEQRALLDVIANKTLTSFDATNAGITRLVRLGEKNSTVYQFGIELQLKRLLNSKLFGDSSYLKSMFDSVTTAIMDAGISGKSDITNFNSVVQTWLGAMYSSGLSDNVVNAIAKGINALGSGNVSALAQDESIQRLFLLSMDRINMDYADVLQQGLSSEDANNLLSSIIQYLGEIAKNTSDNLVLKSSYSNLFNLSMTDMKAIQNLAADNSKLSAISNSFASKYSASAVTQDAVLNIVKNNTLASEQFENFFSNLSYAFGSNIADNNTLYTTYRIADITADLTSKFKDVKGVVGKTATLANKIASITQYTIGTIGLIDMLIGTDANAFNNNAMINLLGDLSDANSVSGALSYGTSTVAGIASDVLQEAQSTDNSGALQKFKTLSSTDYEKSKFKQDINAWEKEDKETSADILDDISKTIMKSKNGYAIAVSLEGMNDEVLRSFASIFADEDAMLATFKGDNKVLEDALFEYAEDTTSNTKSKKSKNK